MLDYFLMKIPEKSLKSSEAGQVGNRKGLGLEMGFLIHTVFAQCQECA